MGDFSLHVGRPRWGWRQAAITAASLAVIAGIGTMVACSAEPRENVGVEADATAPEGDANARTNDATGDGGHEASTPGNCSPVTGTCDVVSQNCSPGEECAVVPVDGGYTSRCRLTVPSQQKQKGQACCPTTNPNSNPCLPGLWCYGRTCSAGSAPTGRCAPACCDGDDSVCGTSPDGFRGKCDTGLSDGDGGQLHHICTYSMVCKPLGGLACPSPNFACNVIDAQGSAKCVEIYSGTGKTEGQACKYANDCADGLMCLGFQGQESTCRMLCLTPGSSPPFDAGAGGPGTGGCSSGKACSGRLSTTQFPEWISFCE